VKRMRLRHVVAAIMVLAAACGCASGCAARVESGITIEIDTDAVVPGDPQFRAVLFDRVRVQLSPADSETNCTGCIREFALTHASLAAHQLSFQALPRVASRVRITMYRSIDGREPLPRMRLVRNVELPPVREGTVASYRIMMSTGQVGRRELREGYADSDQNRNGASAVGTWPPAIATRCASVGPPGSVAVDGGAFWFGEPLLFPGSQVLAILPPFYVDAHEVDAGSYQAAGGKRGRVNTFDRLVCNDEPLRPDHPANCMNRGRAASYCVAHGGTLPSQAQFEYLATVRGTRKYPWGNEPPTCSDAVVARVKDGLFQLAGSCSDRDPLRFPEGTEPVGPLRDDQHTRDFIDFPTGRVWDLAGNVSEWVTGNSNLPGLPCYSDDDNVVLLSPECRHKMVSEYVSRGGSILGAAAGNEANSSSTEDRWDANPSIGFRCVYSCQQ
jgi:formylglycine-generating enzyme required for sulfatase activity